MASEELQQEESKFWILIGLTGLHISGLINTLLLYDDESELEIEPRPGFLQRSQIIISDVSSDDVKSNDLALITFKINSTKLFLTYFNNSVLSILYNSWKSRI